MNLTIIAQKQDRTIVPPRTKKNSPQMIPHMKHPRLVPSEAYREWHRAALATLIREGVCQRVREDGELITRFSGKPIAYPVNMRAIFYRDRLVGDSVGFYQAIGDFLQDVGILENDKWIVSWDGSRLFKDPKQPRIEIEITPAAEAGNARLFS